MIRWSMFRRARFLVAAGLCSLLSIGTATSSGAAPATLAGVVLSNGGSCAGHSVEFAGVNVSGSIWTFEFVVGPSIATCTIVDAGKVTGKWEPNHNALCSSVVPQAGDILNVGNTGSFCLANSGLLDFAVPFTACGLFMCTSGDAIVVRSG